MAFPQTLIRGAQVLFIAMAALLLTGCEETKTASADRFQRPYQPRFLLKKSDIDGVLGYTFGHLMDRGDLSRLFELYERSPSDKTTRWLNPSTGKEFAVRPAPAFRTTEGIFCREAEVSLIDGKRVQTILQQACRRPSGHWRPA